MSYEASMSQVNASGIVADGPARVVLACFGPSSPDKKKDPVVSLGLTRFRQLGSWLLNKNTYPTRSVMVYVGMDISSKDFVVHALNERKKLRFKGSISPSKKGIRDLIAALGPERRLFVFEAGNQMKWIADYFKQLNEDIHVVHPNEVKWIAESGGKKTDKIDAKKLAELARADMLPRAVYIAEGKVRALRELTTARETLLRKRVSMVNSLRGYLRQEGTRLPSKFFQSNDWQVKLIAMKLSAATEAIVASFMAAIESMIVSEKSLGSEIIKIKDEAIERIETIPGIGHLSSRILFGAIANTDRFASSKEIANYGALTPTIYQSGEETRMGAVSRAGRKEIRRALLQCSHAVVRMKTAAAKPLQEFFLRVEKRRGKKRALIALARKMLTVVYAVWKSG
jgi:transposase